MFIGNIIYANVPRMMEGKAISSDEILEGKVYDITGLITLNNMIDLVVTAGAKHPDDLLRKLIEM